MLAFFAQVRPHLIGMESCGGSHWRLKETQNLVEFKE